MLDEDSFTVQMNENQALLETQLAVSSFIGLQRLQKLDLLIHLVTNLRLSFVIYGPKEVGKSSLLTEFKQLNPLGWLTVSVQAVVDLNFDDIEKQTQDVVSQLSPDYQYQRLPVILSSLQKQGQKVVVLLDDAGLLAPGLISTLLKYAAERDSISFVFSLTEEELDLKRRTDGLIADCHFIGVPPLTENQCAELLQNLATNNVGTFSSNSGQFMLEKLYWKTQGIPGKLVTELTGLANYHVIRSYKMGLLVCFIAIIMSAGLKYFIGDETPIKLTREKITIVLDLKPSALLASVVSDREVEAKELTAELEVSNNDNNDKMDEDNSLSDVRNIVVDEEVEGREKNP